ncbi:unnamed protein product [Phytomonas sp. EM1]|nr:unnamed protein product [Phytomonas sp. EM1]|eukprot:CCW60648.1 unnamed protein product [Phytomonas sp. isolate EM1]
MGLGVKICMIFCYWNAVCAFFIAYLFNIKLISLSIISVRSNWDSAEKARACMHAALIYFIIALVLNIGSIFQNRTNAFRNFSALDSRTQSLEVGNSSMMSIPLLAPLDHRYGTPGDGSLDRDVKVRPYGT